MKTPFLSRGCAFFLCVVLALPLFGIFPSLSVYAVGGRNGECEDASFRGVTQSTQTVSYALSDGQIISGVCIKAGNDMFSDGHSGTLDNGTYENGCYTVSGVGSQTVTVTKIGDGRGCKDISHIDVYASNVSPTISVSPTVVPTPTTTPEETPGMSGTPTPTLTVTPPAAQTVTPTPGSASTSNGTTGTTHETASGSPSKCDSSKPATVHVSLTNLGSGSVRLNWNAVPDASGYVLSYGTKSGQYAYGVSDTGNSTTYDIGGLTSGTRYYFVVYAKNGCAIGDPSNEVSSAGYGRGGVLGVSTYSGENGQVLGASTDGDVLGASTMAATGSADDLITSALVLMGSFMSLAGVFMRKGNA